jgi:hypothetical protein
MGRQIIRLTESDLHRIIKESVRRVIKEEKEDLEAQYKAACAKVKALKGKGDKKAFIAAAQEMNALKEKLGKANIVKVPQGKSLPGHEGDNSGTELKQKKEEGSKHKHQHIWNAVKDNLANKKAMDQEHFQKPKVNDIDAALGAQNN